MIKSGTTCQTVWVHNKPGFSTADTYAKPITLPAAPWERTA